MSRHPPAADPVPPGMTAWSADQVVRLEYEWRELRRAFAYHPHVELVPLSGDPPAEYQVNYKVTTLAIDQSGQLAYVSSCPVHLWLPPQYPHNAPVVRPMTAVFHPNVAMEWVHLNPAWRPEATLVEVVAQVGMLLAYQTYDPAAVVNPVAMNWSYANPHLLPTDPAADFTPAAEGGPTSRIERFGPATLRELQDELESMAERLTAADVPPPTEELEQLAREVGATLPLFQDPELPAHLRATAAEVGEFAESLRGPDRVWSRIGRQLVLSGNVATAAGAVAKAEESIRRVLAAEAVRPAPIAEPGAARGERADPSGAGLPPMPAPTLVQPSVAALRRAVRDAEQAIGSLRERLGQLATVPSRHAAALPNAMLSRRLAREFARLSDAAEPARASGAALASLEPVLHEARHELACAERVAAWAEHRDLLRRGHELTTRLKRTPAESLQAYSIESASGKLGPIEYEQRVDPGDGGTALVVWNLRAGLVRVVDAETETVVGRGDGRVAVARGANGAALSVVVGDHTDELRAQLEYLITHARDAVARLRPPEEEPDRPAVSPTWAGKLARQLDAPDAQARAEEDHRAAIDEWKQLLSDLAALGRFKHRMATVHLLGRLVEFVPRARAERERRLGVMSRVDALLAHIGARSSGDADSDRLIIPSQYAAEYSAHVAEREQAQQTIQQLQLAVDGSVERLKLRLRKSRLYGSADVPQLRLLPAPPPAYAEQQPRLTDEALQSLVRRLEELLGTPLGGPPPAASAPHAANSDTAVGITPPPE